MNKEQEGKLKAANFLINHPRNTKSHSGKTVKSTPTSTSKNATTITRSSTLDR